MMTLEQILTDVFACDSDSLGDGTDLKSIPSWDSMTHMILITRVESEFEIQMTGDEIATLETVGDLRKIVARGETGA